MNRFSIALSLALSAGAAAQTYTVSAVVTDPAALGSWATGVTSDGRVFGAQSMEAGRRTFGFIWRNGALEQLVVPQAGDFSVRPRSLDISHHVAVLAMTSAGTYGGDGANVNLGFSSQPFFAWIPSSDPYPAEFVAAENLGSAIVMGLAETPPYTTGVGAGTPAGTNIREGFITQLSRSDDDGSPPRMTFVNGVGGGSGSSAVLAVNSSGDAVGYAANSSNVNRPFLRPAATSVATDLGTLGGPSGAAEAITDTGYIAGYADVSVGHPHAFLRSPGASTLTDLGTLGGQTSTAWGVNGSGDVVGESWTADGLVHAFLWHAGAMIDLNSRISAGSGWVLTHASGINDQGMIVGWGQFAGKTAAFVLRPGVSCYANCDSSTQAPVLNIADFTCFLMKFAASDPYANCDNSTQAPMLNVADFTCFLGKFAAGCP